MASQWLRLWHDMPTDPKWRTIAKVSGERIGDVIAVFVYQLVSASSNATERGRTHSFNAEDVATALNLETEQVQKITAAMQSRVIEGDKLIGWEKRQPAREDGSAERSKAWREQKKNAKGTQSNAPERKRALDKDTDTDDLSLSGRTEKQSKTEPTVTQLPQEWLDVAKSGRPDLTDKDIERAFEKLVTHAAKQKKPVEQAGWLDWILLEKAPRGQKPSATPAVKTAQLTIEAESAEGEKSVICMSAGADHQQAAKAAMSKFPSRVNGKTRYIVVTPDKGQASRFALSELTMRL